MEYLVKSECLRILIDGLKEGRDPSEVLYDWDHTRGKDGCKFVVKEGEIAQEPCQHCEERNHRRCEELSRRVTVESELFQMAAGKKPLPDAEDCQRMAMKLGVPE